MKGLLPIVEFLAAATTDRERAEWLSAVPMGVIQRDHLDIGAVLERAGFIAGHAYLVALSAQNNARRLQDGRYPQTILMATEHARLLMWAAAKQCDDNGEAVE